MSGSGTRCSEPDTAAHPTRRTVCRTGVARTQLEPRAGGDSGPTLVLMHSGGCTGSRRDLEENRQVGHALAARDYVVASIGDRSWQDRPVISD